MVTESGAEWGAQRCHELDCIPRSTKGLPPWAKSCSVSSKAMSETPKPNRDTIRCPNCGELIPISETLHHQLSEQARAELRQELAKEQKALAAREKQLKAREEGLRASEESLDRRVEDRVAAEKSRLAKEALKKAREEASIELRELKEASAEKDRKLQEAQSKELELRKEKRQLEAAKKTLELDIARKLDAERQKIRDEAAKEFLDEHRLKDAEKDRKLQDALRVNEELRRKLEQGSQQTQGEVLELELEKLLAANCPFDEILPVPKGIRGGDILQRVHTRSGFHCGVILWETKHTKNWSDGWIHKLKDDQREAKADIAVIVSDGLPKDIDGFGSRDGVWIASPRYAIGLLLALRNTLTEVAFAKSAAASKDQTIEALFQYVTGPQFRQRVEASIRAFMKMREELEEEKRTTVRRWSKREKQLDMIVGNTSGMYGDLQGLLGSSMQPIPLLEAGEEVESGQEAPENVEAESENAKPDEDVPF